MPTDASDMLFGEWKEVRESLRYFGNKRFAQLTVFLTGSGLLFSAVLGNPAPRQRDLCLIGLVTGVLFLFMEISSIWLYARFARRAKEIEGLSSPAVIRLTSAYRPRPALWLGDG